jgi:hypothetical protein
MSEMTPVNSYSGLPKKPGQVQTIAILTLISGILNILEGVVGAILLVVGTLGLGIFCLPIALLPIVLGIFEIIYASKLLPENPRPIQPSQTLAIFQIVAVLWGAVLSVVTGILALVFYNDPDVKAYFASINTPQV